MIVLAETMFIVVTPLYMFGAIILFLLLFTAYAYLMAAVDKVKDRVKKFFKKGKGHTGSNP